MPALLTRMSTWPERRLGVLDQRVDRVGIGEVGGERRARGRPARLPAPASAVRAACRRARPARPAPCSACAIAPPMPPEAPVTRAVLPVRSNMMSPAVTAKWRGTLLQRLDEGFDVGRRRWRSPVKLGLDALGQAGEHLAGADLDDARRHPSSAISSTLSRQRTRPVTCSTSSLRIVSGIAGRRCAVTLATSGTRGGAIVDRGQRLGHDVGGRLHQRRNGTAR